MLKILFSVWTEAQQRSQAPPPQVLALVELSIPLVSLSMGLQVDKKRLR